jgi:hypothetical protein
MTNTRARIVHTMIGSRDAAAQVRSLMDSSEFGPYAELAMLIADHDLHYPEDLSSGEERRDALTHYLRALAARATSAVAGRSADPRANMALNALTALSELTGPVPDQDELPELLAALRPGEPGVPHQHRGAQD